MKTRLVLAMAGLFCVTMAGAEVRTFTNSAGKQIRAELLALENEAAVLKLANGRNAKVPLTSLAKEDQDFVKAWWEENKNKVTASDVRLTIQKNSKRLRNDSKDKKGNKKGSNKTQIETSWTCKLENLSTKTIEGITANYVIYEKVSTRDESGSDTRTEETNNGAEVGTLAPNGKLEFTSDSEISEDSETRKKDVTETRRETIVGFVVELSVDERVFLKQSHPENLLDRLEEEAKREAARKKSR